MKLSDVMSAAGLAGYAQIAMVLFLIVFVGVGIRVLFARRATMERAARIPLDDDSAPPATPPDGEG
jgi:cbb3-type cytochrome oxidase subunit 3